MNLEKLYWIVARLFYTKLSKLPGGDFLLKVGKKYARPLLVSTYKSYIKLKSYLFNLYKSGSRLVTSGIFLFKSRFNENYQPSSIDPAGFRSLLHKLQIKSNENRVLPKILRYSHPSNIIDLQLVLTHIRENEDKSDPSQANFIFTRKTINAFSENTPLNILFVTGQFPLKSHGGGERVLSFIRSLSQSKHRLSLYSIKDYSFPDIQLESSLNEDCEIVEIVDYHNFILKDRLEVFINKYMPEIVHYEWPLASKIIINDKNMTSFFTYMEVVSLRLLIDLNLEKYLSKKWCEVFWKLVEALRIEVIETSSIDCNITVTKKDAEFLARFNPETPYFVINHGIDLEEYEIPLGLSEPNTITFVGNYQHYPNSVAVEFFFDTIYERVVREIPELKIYLVGANPDEKIRRYSRIKNVYVTGLVKDIKPFIQKAAVCIAPLISGAGLRTKVIQYAALARPCVGTTIANEDLLFEDGRDIFVTNDPIEFSNKITFLLKNPEIAQVMGENARKIAFEQYDNRLLSQSFDNLYGLWGKGNFFNLDVKVTAPDIIIFEAAKQNIDLSIREKLIVSLGKHRRYFFLPKTLRPFSGNKYFEKIVAKYSIYEATLLIMDSDWSEIAAELATQHSWKTVDLTVTNNTTHPRESLQTSISRLYEKASIVILSYEGYDFIRQCIKSILENTIYPNYEIIIVDNDSKDKRVKNFLAKLKTTNHGRIKVIQNKSNLGFSAGNNIGLLAAKGSEFLILLNNDTVVTKGWLTRLIHHARKPDVGLVGPVTNHIGNEAMINVTYTSLDAMQDFAKEYTQSHSDKIFDIRVAAMYCVAMRNEVYKKIGPLDEIFGQGMFEDEDYANRVRNKGFRVVCAEDVFVHHIGSGAFNKLQREEYIKLFDENKKKYEEKWGVKWVPYKARTT